jgi:uncharacterized cofD-like protein
MDKRVKYVVIGGGTGSFSVLSGLKQYATDISALVSMADDGGSTGSLREELGVLPPGDVRQCLIALSEASEEVQDLFDFRFKEGSLAGHSFGNLFLSAVEKMTNDFGDAVRMAGDVLNIKGRVLPITLDNVRLGVRWPDGTTVEGQGKIDVTNFVAEKGLPELYLTPKGKINPKATDAIRQADIILIAPGDIYTSLGPLLIVDGVKEALAESKAKVAYICNLMVKPGHTKGFTVADHAAEIERFAGGPILDYVLYNTALPDFELFDKYAREGEVLVEANQDEFASAHYEAIGWSMVAKSAVEPDQADVLSKQRSYIRHDLQATVDAISKIL